MESDEFIKSSVENLVPIPSESEDFSDIKSECDIPDCDDSQMTNFSTFSNPLFDDSTSSDDESSHEEFPVIHQPPQEMSIQEMKDLKQQYLDEMKRLINSKHHDEIKIDELKGNFNRMSIEINKKEKLQQLEQVANLNTYPSKRFNSFCYDDDDDDEDYTVVITPDFPITDSLIMENEHLDTISETESDEFIKSSVENLVSIPNLDSTPKNDRFDTKSYLFESLLNHDESIPPGIDSDDSYSEGDNLFLERLLHDDPIPLPDTLDFSNVVRVFLPFFTYPVTSLILLFSGSEDTIFNPGIFD
uniref:Reverse transcriptase domain-containing protein n=1 Tax=Tanacetum cinerariifolium TaxID=118510 RepID=A0A6L2L4C4_TANCI|nr:hypothetical protein [Tanacetum cinerariifolium]